MKRPLILLLMFLGCQWGAWGPFANQPLVAPGKLVVSVGFWMTWGMLPLLSASLVTFGRRFVLTARAAWFALLRASSPAGNPASRPVQELSQTMSDFPLGRRVYPERQSHR